MPAPHAVAVVPVRPVWQSKIVILAVLTIVAAVLTRWAIPFPPEVREAVGLLIEVAVPAVMIVLRGWFTRSVLATSLPADMPVVLVVNPRGEPDVAAVSIIGPPPIAGD